MHNPKAILLDLDDTIISFDGLTNAAWNTACRKYVEEHKPPFDIAALRQKIREKGNEYWGDPKRHKEGRSNLPAARRRIVKLVFEDLGIFEEDLAFELADGYSAMHDASRCLMEGAFQALENMRSMDIRMAVITNGATEVQREKIHRFGLEHFFEFVLIDEEVGYSKPDARIYEIALEKLALEPKDVWMVGDNLLWDVEGAQKLGIFAVWNDYNQKGLPEDAAVHPDMTVSSIYELSQELQKNTVKYDCILFDADDTLFDFDQAEASAIENTFIHFGCTFDDQIYAKYREINKSLWKQWGEGRITVSELQHERFLRILQFAGIQDDPLAFNQHYLEALADGSQLLEGAEEICSTLSKICRLAIVTNGISSTQHRRFDQSTIKTYFEDIFVSGDIGYQKPMTEFFDVVFSSMHITDPEKVLIVGDSLTSDIQGGNNAGISTCWYNPDGKINDTGAKADYEIRSLDELTRIVISTDRIS